MCAIEKRRVVFGATDWPEADAQDFEITDVRLGEADEDAISRAKKAYSDDLECYIKDVEVV